MSGTVAVTSPVAFIDSAGIHAPSYDEVLTYYQNGYRSIYGQDVYLESDSQDGQLLALIAQGVHDSNSLAVAVWNAFSPATAVGVGLSNNVKINGMSRSVSTNSQAELVLAGAVRTAINNGIAKDRSGNQWALPASVVIDDFGAATVTAVCTQTGAITAQAGDINAIATPTLGWLTVTNPAAATPGAPVEQDNALRQRQTISTAAPSQTVMDGLRGAIAALPGVTRSIGIENKTGSPDVNGIPGHTVCFVVEGGDDMQIAQTIQLRKTIGADTFGTTTVTLPDAYGNADSVSFFRPTEVPISVEIDIQAITGMGYSSTTGVAIQAAVLDYGNTSYNIGVPVYTTRLYLPANLNGGPLSNTYDVIGVQLSRDGAPLGPANVNIAFNEVAEFTAGAITLVVST